MASSRRFIALVLTVSVAACASIVCAQGFDTAEVSDEQAPEAKSAPAKAQPGQMVRHAEVSLQKDSSSAVGHHHYANDAERARDDLLITEVKSALAQDGISDNYPVEVDADHGTITLSGVVASKGDVRAAAADAARVRGVVAVQNQLRPR